MSQQLQVGPRNLAGPHCPNRQQSSDADHPLARIVPGVEVGDGPGRVPDAVEDFQPQVDLVGSIPLSQLAGGVPELGRVVEEDKAAPL